MDFAEKLLILYATCHQALLSQRKLLKRRWVAVFSKIIFSHLSSVIEYVLDKAGRITSEKKVGFQTSGTALTASNLFHNIPVRRQNLQSNEKQSSKKISDLVIAYSLIHPNVRFSLKFISKKMDTKKNVEKPIVNSILDAIRSLYGSSFTSGLKEYHKEVPINNGKKILIDCISPHPKSGKK